MALNELETVVLVRDLPALGLKRGDVGTVVHIYASGPAAEIEFVSGAGKTVAVETLALSEVRRLAEGEILHARAFAA